MQIERSLSIRALLASAALAGFAAAVLAQPGEDGESRVATPAVEQIGADCADCHAEIVAAFRATGMARAVEVPRAGELDAFAGTTLSAGGFDYTLAGSNIVETHPEFPAYERSAPLVLAIGAGLVDRSYALELDGRLWFAPIEVLTGELGEESHAALAPGHMAQPDQRFGNPITAACLACHTDAALEFDYPENRPSQADWNVRGIGCGACHPGATEHVAQREAELAGGAAVADDPIFTHGEGPIERMSTCARCHLQGDARFSVKHDGPVLPQPGGDLLDERVVFIASEPTNEIGFVSQTERLVLSACFQASLESTLPLVCETCHDPHRSMLDSEHEQQLTRAACGKCHAAGKSECTLDRNARGERDCVSCHMRRTAPFDVHDVTVYDHWIRTEPGPPSEYGDALRIYESTGGRVAPFTWPGRPAPAYLSDKGLKLMALMQVGEPRLAAQLVDEPAGDVSRRHPRYHHMRASLLEQQGQHEAARKSYLRALIFDRTRPETLTNLGLLLARMGQAEAGLERLNTVVEAHPAADSALRNRALVRRALGDVDGYQSDLEAAFAARASAEVARALAALFDERGDEATAQAWRARALAVDPRR